MKPPPKPPAKQPSPEESGQWKAPLVAAQARLGEATSQLEQLVDSDVPRRFVVAAAARAARRADPGRGRVLVVEDDDLMARVLTRELESFGFFVVWAKNYNEGCARLVESWEAVVADILLDPPRSLAYLHGTPPTGIELAEQARTAGVPRVVLITAWESGHELERIRAACGAHAALTKPFTAAALLEAVRPAYSARAHG